MRPFGCPITILNTIDHLGKFDGKADEGFFVGYSLNSKAFRVFNSRTRIVEENLHIRFSESTPNVVGSGPDWLFDIDALTRTMNYEPIVAGTQSNGFAGIKASDIAGQARKETEPVKDYICYHYGLLIHHFPKIQRILMMMDPNLQVMMERRRTQKGNSCIKGSKLDRGYAGRASIIQATRSLDFSGFTKWKKAIGTKWVFKNKKDERGIVIRNKARLVAQWYTQEEGIDYDDVFAPVARIKAIRLFFSYASLKIFGVSKRSLKGQPKTCAFGYPKDSPLDLVAYTNSDYARASLDRKSTTGEQFWSTVNREVQLQALVDGKKIIITESTVRRDLQLEDAEGVDFLPNSTIFEQLTLTGVESSGDEEKDACIVDVNTLTDDEVLAKQEVATKDVNLTINEVTLAQALAALKSVKPKLKDNVVEELTEEEEERLAREKAQQIEEANIAWDDVQAKVEADYQLAQRLQAQEQEELTDEEKARLFVQFLEQRRKHFAAKRAEEKRNRPPTRAQQRNIMCTYLKNMEGWKPKSLKNKSFANIQELFEKAMKRVNTFVDYRTELVEESSKKAETELEENLKKAEAEVMEGSSKRAGTELEQEVTKKQKVDDVQETTEVDNDQEAAKIKELMEIVPDKEEVAIDAIPLAVKPPSIVDWKIHKEGKKTYYQIIRADGSSNMYLVFSHMLKSFDKEDLETLWKLVKVKHGSTRPEEGYKGVLWDDLKSTSVEFKNPLWASHLNILGLYGRKFPWKTAMQKMGIVVSIIHATIKFHTPYRIDTVPSSYESNKIKEGEKKIKETQ
ncbi:reverse transcriptase domain-containing protein [Tanacetum coccineum]